MSHHPLSPAQLPRGLGYVLGLVTAVDFCSTLSVLLAAAEIQAGVAASPAEFLWVLSLYAAAGVATLPLIERASRRWHYRELMLGGMLLFCIGAVLAMCADNLATLLLARVLQGLGGGGLFTMSRVYLQLAVPQAARPKELKGYILGLLGSVAPLSWLTAELVQNFGWRACFALQAVFAVAVVWLVRSRLRSEQHTPRSLGALDWRMSLFFAVGMLLLLHGLEDLELLRLDGEQLLPLGLGMLALLAAAWRAHGHPDPLLRLDVLNGRRYLAGLGFYALYYFINGATAFIYPKLFAQGTGFDLPTVGMLQSFSALVTVACLPLYFRFAPRLGDRRRMIAVGFALAAIGLLWLACSLTTAAPWQALLGPLALKGLFPVCAVIQIAGLSYTEVPHEDFAHAYALKNIVRLVANTLAAGLASQHWLSLAAAERTALVERVNPFNPDFFGSVWADGARGLQLISLEIDRQVAVLAGSSLLLTLAVVCLVCAPLVLWQQRLR